MFRIPAAERSAATRMGIPQALLDQFPATTEGTALSRSSGYYAPRIGLRAAPELYDALRVIDRRSDRPAPALRRALVENLHNVYAAVAYTVWEHLTDQVRTSGVDEKVLDSLLEAGTRLSADLAGTAPRGWTEEPLPDLAPFSSLASLRVFRELDSQAKLHDELDFLLTHVIDEYPEITSVVVPLYGSFSLGLAARAILPVARPHRKLSVHLIRLGFHDLSTVDYKRTDGTIRSELVGPPEQRERLAADVHGAHVLVVDDNVGYGTTLRAARTLIGQLGGRALTRSVETAWHLYSRDGRHDVADAADLPSLRPNLHHRIQDRLIGHLLRGDADAYADDSAHAVRSTLHQQMRTSYDMALGLGTLAPRQLRAMRAELAHAVLNWREPPVPPAPVTLSGRRAA
ncbi:phosphoribosyltransferase [Streptomyces sp. NBC_01275]|uniref:phosphoribosyltransferase n=1 Tax=Streptomyces sp. NBC_01275 TaxID=2903807 RepID=UPI002256D54B|nr:phosphoribosyltransferase [Streptomyces sp. NBC_01275]MCX4763633.1 phosphoribosyltransferase [Streptomyces sp. NBC_01275]